MRSFDRLELVLKEKRWKDADLYNRLQISKQRYNGWKQRGSIPKEMLSVVADTIGVYVSWLLTGDGPKHIGTQASEKKPPQSYLTPDEHALLEKYRGLSGDKRIAVKAVIDVLDQPETREKAE